MLASLPAVFCTLWVFAVLSGLQEVPEVSPRNFVGTWVGLQTWSPDVASPSAQEPQPVELTVELVDGKLTGTMIPFFGGTDGATFAEARIVGDELRASALMGRSAGWKGAVRILYKLKYDGVRLAGTADVSMGDVNWMTYHYDLSLRRSRY